MSAEAGDWNIVSLLEVLSFDSSELQVSNLLTALRQPDVVTENGAFAHSTTDSAIVDLFGKLTRDQDEAELERLFDLSWRESPVRLVQLLHYTRDCRTALGEKKLFYTLALRLRKLYPLTYLRNLSSFIGAGYFKDLLNLVKQLEISSAPKLAGADFVELLVFKQQLLADQRALLADSDARVSLAGKWAPSVGKHFDQFAKRLAKLIFGKHPQLHKQYRELLSRLRAHLRVVEVSMCASHWENIAYSTVPARAMKIYRNAFRTHDEDRFQEYMGQVKRGERKINTTGLQPHDLVRVYIENEQVVGDEGVDGVDETVELQWRTMVDKIRASEAKMANTLAVVDVSGSMEGTPMEVAIALGLLCSELTTGAFEDVVCTFHETPTLVKLEKAETLKQRVETLSRIPWGGSTNFEAVMDLILEKYKNEKLKKSDIPELVICFTDMQFDCAQMQSSGEGSMEVGTLHDVVKRKFEALKLKCPKFVFWNLRASSSAFPIKKDTPDTAVVSGYSGELMKLFLQGDTNFDPIALVKKALDGRPASIDPSELPSSF